MEYVDQPEEIFNAGDFFVLLGHRPYMLEDTELPQITDKDEFGAFMKKLGDAGLIPRGDGRTLAFALSVPAPIR